MMDAQFWKATAITLAINLVYAVLALVIGVAAFRWIDKTLFPEIDFMEEIRKGNMAAAVFAGVLLLFVALILAGALGK
jgi:uncharacterized membrane protein YjfL (UPF0719 family)